MISYDYRFIVGMVAIIIAVPLCLYLTFPHPLLFAIVYIALPLILVLWHYVNFLRIGEDSMVLTKIWKKKTIYFKDIDVLVIAEDTVFNSATLRMYVIMKGKPLTVHFGNISFLEADHIEKLLESKVKVIRA
ncbi:MAG: hypothetical protein Q4D30_05580 [Bacteroidales bacterium]|nr:hypothetical protein [Bacteroidales bacterium]